MVSPIFSKAAENDLPVPNEAPGNHAAIAK
jgi:hypothetical protein